MARRICTVAGCGSPHNAKGFCALHYSRWRKHGDPLVGGYPTMEQRFWRGVDKNGSDGCWVWTRACTSAGYGQINLPGKEGRAIYTHRYAYELLVGPIPDGLVIDHLCRNKACCNPTHLEPVHNRENIRRGNTAAMGWRRDLTHCKRGHEFNNENTNITLAGTRECRVCKREKMRRRRAAQREGS